MANNESTTPQSEPTPRQVEAAEVWNQALISCVRRIQRLEEAHIVRQALIEQHEKRIAALEALLTGGANA